MWYYSPVRCTRSSASHIPPAYLLDGACLLLTTRGYASSYPNLRISYGKRFTCCACFSANVCFLSIVTETWEGLASITIARPQAPHSLYSIVPLHIAPPACSATVPGKRQCQASRCLVVHRRRYYGMAKQPRRLMHASCRQALEEAKTGTISTFYRQSYHLHSNHSRAIE
ncbi:hypothetical protein K402DRAFT_9053 [Aulographum hederae CBS 113979]|uniref:Uncharacterized protein n=1 Tax=Aulographum hederae CBS 113979 TaxID=1176131 RepID=A0A6G1HHZ0_9PEZI|nr:hypothetical protein K402DRAFT_9053 [Aulographum hederae CBS 113979]